MKKLVLFSLALLLTAAVFAKDIVVPEYLTPSKNPKKGGTLYICLKDAPQTFNYSGSMSASSFKVLQGDEGAPGSGIFSSLVALNPVTMEVEPSLAESWEYKGDKEVIFHLRDVKWSDGVPFTADDVIFTMDKFVQNKYAMMSGREGQTVNGKLIKWEKVDKKTIKAILPASYGPFLTILSYTLMYPKHKLEKLIDPKDPASTNNLWTTDTDPKEIVGTGPFMIEKYVPGQSLILKKNPYYYKIDKYGNRLPYIDKLVYLIIKDPQMQIAKFLSNELSILTPINATDYPMLKQKELNGADFFIYRGVPMKPTPSVFHISFNFDDKDKDLRELFRNVKFREAMAYALDRDRIIEEIFNTLAIKNVTPVLPTNPFHNKNALKKQRKFNLKKASEILDSLGLKDKNGDGIREFPDGKKVEFVLTTKTEKTYQDIAFLYSRDLKTIGVKVNLQPLESNLMSEKCINGNYDISLWAFGNQSDPQLRREIWQPGNYLYYNHLSTLDKKTKTPVKSNMTDWEKKVWNDFDQGQKATQMKERQKYYNDWQEIYADKLPFIFVCKPMEIAAVHKNIGNYYKNKEGQIVGTYYTMYKK